MSEIETIILGDEYDEALREALRNVLLNKGAQTLANNWGFAGSQEIETMQVIVERL